MNESFWDAHGVEIGACTFFDIFYRSDKNYRPDKKMSDWMLWVRSDRARGPRTQKVNPVIFVAVPANFAGLGKRLENAHASISTPRASQKGGGPKMFGICACLNPDAMSVPEALVESIRILVAPAVFLAHQWLKS